MADPKYEAKLNELLTKDVIVSACQWHKFILNWRFVIIWQQASDFVTYIKKLIDLNDSLEQENGFHTFAPGVKNWIGEFEVRFVIYFCTKFIFEFTLAHMTVSLPLHFSSALI